MKPTFGSLFAGVGGFDMGMEQAGWECKFQVEWDKHCQHILNKHWPDIPKWGDVSTVSGTEIPPVDCIIFGSPCQDLSVAGKRAGLQGERSGLFYEAVRIIKEMRHVTNGTFPRWAIWENVAGALSSNNGRDFAAVISEMAEAGAVLQEYALLDAQYFGIPQRRRRVFLVACFDPAIARNCPDPLLPVSESLRGNTAKGKPKRQVASSETSAGFGSSGVEPFVKSRRAQSASDDETWVEGQVNPTLNSFDMGDTRSTTAIVTNEVVKDPVGTLQARVAATNHESIRDGHAIITETHLLDGTRVNDVRIYEPPVQTLQARMGTGGNNVPMLAFDTQFGSNANVFEDRSPTLKASQQSPSVAYPIDARNALRDPEKYDAQNRQGLGIGADGDPMATLTSAHVNAVAYDEYNDSINETHHALRAGTKQSTGVLEPTMAVRRLTPLECERLMGWPDDHTRWKADGTEQADTHRYKQCGNGVASPVAQWIATHILKAHR
jgi:DNA (cytosine-5)-methyltransferase 1